MAVLVMDSFDAYDTPNINHRDNLIGGVSVYGDSITKWGAGNSCGPTTQGPIYEFDDDQSGNILIFGCHAYIPTGIQSSYFFRIYHTDTNAQFAGVIANYPGMDFTILGNTGTASYSFNEWFHIELKIKVINSTASGECVLKINGVEDLNLTGVDTQVRSTDAVGRFQTHYSNSGFYVDDFYVLDTTGTYANDFLGPKARIECLRPNGNGNYADFVGSDSNSVDNYLHVDESDVDDDTSYSQSSTVTHRDSYLLSNITGAITGNPLAVQVNNISRKEGSNETRSINNFVRISSTDYDNSNVTYPPLGTFVATNDIYDASPATTNQWTTAEVNALEAGIEVNS